MTLALVRSDEDIKADIVEHLLWDGRVDASDITVAVDDGIVTLGGVTDTYFSQTSAIEDAWTVKGVNDIVSEIAIRSSAAPLSEEELRGNVETALRLNSSIEQGPIKVEVENDSVQLTGSVNAYWKKIVAEDVASHVPRVAKVENNLSVVPRLESPDTKIAERLKAALDRNIFVDGHQLNLNVDHGCVQLSGTVPTTAARRAAVQVAYNTDGVLEVEDRITVAGYNSETQ